MAGTESLPADAENGAVATACENIPNEGSSWSTPIVSVSNAFARSRSAHMRMRCDCSEQAWNFRMAMESICFCQPSLDNVSSTPFCINIGSRALLIVLFGAIVAKHCDRFAICLFLLFCLVTSTSAILGSNLSCFLRFLRRGW